MHFNLQREDNLSIKDTLRGPLSIILVHFNLQWEDNLSLKDKMACPKRFHYSVVPLYTEYISTRKHWHRLLSSHNYDSLPSTAIDQKHWRKLTGRFSNIMVCPHACSTHHAPLGFSPYGHLGNGGTDIVLLSRCSKLSHARWLLRQKKSGDMVWRQPDMELRTIQLKNILQDAY